MIHSIARLENDRGVAVLMKLLIAGGNKDSWRALSFLYGTDCVMSQVAKQLSKLKRKEFGLSILF